jgi:hypothetical protein
LSKGKSESCVYLSNVSLSTRGFAPSKNSFFYSFSEFTLPGESDVSSESEESPSDLLEKMEANSNLILISIVNVLGNLGLIPLSRSSILIV